MAVPAPLPVEFGWLRLELTHVELGREDLAGLRPSDVVLLDMLWTRTDVGESGFASLFLSTGKHFRVRLARRPDGYVATVTEEREFYRPLNDSTALRLGIDLVQQAFDAREMPDVGIGDELSLHVQPSGALLTSVDHVPLGRCEVVEIEGQVGARILAP